MHYQLIEKLQTIIGVLGIQRVKFRKTNTREHNTLDVFMQVQCWRTVCDAGPASTHGQHLVFAGEVNI